MTLHEISMMNFGVERRAKFIEYLTIPNKFWDGKIPDGIPVNRKWQMNDKDQDLSYLIKKGILKRSREHDRHSGRSNQTYLILGNKK